MNINKLESVQNDLALFTSLEVRLGPFNNLPNNLSKQKLYVIRTTMVNPLSTELFTTFYYSL